MNKSSIINTLKGYQKEINKHHKEYLKETLKYIMPTSDEKTNFNCKSTDYLEYLVKKEIGKYIIHSENSLNIEFFYRVNYYNKLNSSNSFKELMEELRLHINELYSLVDTKIALNLEDKQDDSYYSSFFNNCMDAIKSLNVETEFKREKSCYSQLVNLISNEKNYYTFDFDKSCDEIYEEEMDLAIIEEDNILNINKIIFQYEALEQPLSDNLINKFHNLRLIKDIDKFQDIKSKYKSKIDKLKQLLKKDFKPKKLYSFYLFNKFMNCNFPDKHVLGKDEGFRKCSRCFDSIEVVLTELMQYIENPYGIALTTRQNEVMSLVLQGYANKQIANTLVDKKTGKFLSVSTVEKHIHSILDKANCSESKELIIRYRR